MLYEYTPRGSPEFKAAEQMGQNGENGAPGQGVGRGLGHCRARWASPGQVGGTVMEEAVGRNGTAAERRPEPARLLPCCRLTVKVQGAMVPRGNGAAAGEVLDPPLRACWNVDQILVSHAARGGGWWQWQSPGAESPAALPARLGWGLRDPLPPVQPSCPWRRSCGALRKVSWSCRAGVKSYD